MRLALLVLAQVLVALLFLGLLEAGLRLAGIGEPDASRTSRLKYQQIYLPLLEPGSRADGSAIQRSADKRLANQSILAEKPANALRVITLGGSATAGLGYSPNATFSRELERMLTFAYPDRQVEVLNLGIVALASKQEQLIAADVMRRYAPDIVVVYSGNNEFLEIHAEKYAEAHATFTDRVGDPLMDLNLARALNRALRGAPAVPSLASQNFTRDDLRLSQHEIIQSIDMLPSEVEEIVDAYEANIRAMARDAKQTGTPVLLATSVGNWQWYSRSGLPENWLQELLGSGDPPDAAAYLRARSILEDRLAAAPGSERHEWLFRIATVAEAQGDFDAARNAYRDAMNVDPHLRRGTDFMADRVRKVAREEQVPLFDAIAYLAARARNGIIGFDELYDYVHFTPRGALLMAAGIFDAARLGGQLPPSPGFDLDAHVSARLTWLDGISEDPLEVQDWLGFSFDKTMVHDRDLWKYDRAVQALESRVAEHPDDASALVYLGNARYFQIGGAPEALRFYSAALAIDPDLSAVAANLARLHAEHGI